MAPEPAAIILLITFGSAVAMGLPLLTALFGLGIATAIGELLRSVVDVPDWAPPIAAMVGIGIDYEIGRGGGSPAGQVQFRHLEPRPMLLSVPHGVPE